MTTNNGWPGKPGVPLNPERDGWHWLKRISNGWETLAKWDNDWNGNDDFWWNLPGYSDPEKVAKTFCYLGPVLSHDEATALQKRVVELDKALSELLKTFDGVGFRIGKTHPPHTADDEEAEQYYATNYKGETALFMFQEWRRWKLVHEARAALEGGSHE